MNIVSKSIIAIKDGVFFEKVYRYLFLRMKFCKIFNLVFFRRKINDKKIVFVNFYGAGYGDNPKAIADYILESDFDYELVWLLDKKRSDDLSFPKQIRTVDYFSLKSIYELATAKIWVDNCRKEYCPPKRKGQYYIQTWHGSLALKKIEADAPFLPQQYVNMAKNDSKNIDVILNSYDFMTNIFKNSFWYSEEVLNIGTPRADAFFNGEKIFQNKKKVFNFYKLEDDVNILMYAPTFRQSHNLDIYKLDYPQLENILVNKFGGKWRIIVRLHPNILHLADELQLPYTVLNVTNYKDMQELLCASDVVITDYSSLMFDFYIMNRPVFLFCTDLEEYTSKDRELYFDIRELPFDLAEDNETLCKKINSFNYDNYLKDIQNFKDSVGFCEHGTASRSLFDWINENLN